MQKLLLTLACWLLATAANAQSVQQSGAVTPGHVSSWVTNGVIGDGGSIVNGTTTPNDAACISSTGSLVDCGVPLAHVPPGTIAVGGAGGVPAWVALTGDCTITTAGVISCPSTQGISLGGTPSATQMLVAQSATAYAPKTIGGDCTISTAGSISCVKTGGTAFGPLATQTAPCAVNQGCTGLATLTGNAVLLGAGTSSVNFAAIGTAGRLLVDQGVAANPAFTIVSGDCTINSSGVTTCFATPATVAKGGTGAATLTNHAVLLGAGTSTLGFATIGTSGRLLLDQGASADPSFNALSGSCTVTNAGVITCLPLVKFTKFTAGGTYTADTHLIKAKLECVGGGGSGGGAAGSATGLSSGGGGGAGSYCLTYSTAATIGVSQTVTIATAAAAPSAGNHPGNAGGDASIGSLCVGKGGAGGGGAPANAPGFGAAGGVAGTGDFTPVGAPGSVGMAATIATVFGPSGAGGNSIYGAGGKSISVATAGSAGTAGVNYGGGGGGGQSQGDATDETGGAGGLGVCLVTEFTYQ